MKQEIIRILNDETNKAELAFEKAKLDLNHSSIMAWHQYGGLLKKLVKRLQDEA